MDRTVGGMLYGVESVNVMQCDVMIGLVLVVDVCECLECRRGIVKVKGG